MIYLNRKLENGILLNNIKSEIYPDLDMSYLEKDKFNILVLNNGDIIVETLLKNSEICKEIKDYLCDLKSYHNKNFTKVFSSINSKLIKSASKLLQDIYIKGTVSQDDYKKIMLQNFDDIVKEAREKLFE